MRNLINVALLLIFLATGCKNDFEINDEWSDITIVYGLLNQAETTHYLRIQKAFLGDATAEEMAGHSDSILYQNDLTVRMEEWKNGTLRKNFSYAKTYIDKDSGFFANNGHYVYKTTGNLDPDAEYKIFIERPNNTTVSSTTKLLGSFVINKPYSSLVETISFHSADPYKVEWLSGDGTRVFNLEIIFHYWEITANDTVSKSIRWNNLPTVVSPSLTQGSSMKMELAGTSFQGFLKSVIQDDPAVIKRVVKRKCLDFKFYAGDDNFYTYMQLSAPSNGLVQDKPSFTNIDNGIGLFASRISQSVNNKSLSDRTIDTLSSGVITHDLKFLNTSDTYYFWSTTGE